MSGHEHFYLEAADGREVPGIGGECGKFLLKLGCRNQRITHLKTVAQESLREPFRL